MDSLKKLPQDLHIHTIFSSSDSMIVPEQTIELIAQVRHAEILGISDHFESLHGSAFNDYQKAVRENGFFLGTEVDGFEWVEAAMGYPFDYYLFHCRDSNNDYQAAGTLLETGKPVIISHPTFLHTNLDKVPEQCLIEINNRYVWKSDWRSYYTPYLKKFRFVINSDAHQPWMLNQVMARFVAHELGIIEEILF